MDENIREEIKRLEKELSDLKKLARKSAIKPYLNVEMVEVSPIGCLHHVAKAKDGNRVYQVHKHSCTYQNIYDFARSLFKFSRIDELTHEEAKEVADFCNEIIPIFNKYALERYVVNFDRQRFDEAYQDIIDYLAKNKPGAVGCWMNTKAMDLERILEWREELSNG